MYKDNGHPAQMALGALLIQRRLKCSGEWLVKHIGGNPYLQYFIGMKEYGPCPFGSSALVLDAACRLPPRRYRLSPGYRFAPPGAGESSISWVDGYAGIERLDFEPFNESEDFRRAVARYRDRYGCYPERIWADKIYRSRQTLAFCKEQGIRLSGPSLGKPPKDPLLSLQEKKQEYQDSCGRNAVEGIFGTGKNAYGLGADLGASARNRCVCHWRCLAPLESLQIAQGGPSPVLARCFSAGCGH